jgi:hypothetical protein
VTESSAMSSMPLHGNPDVSQLADRTNPDSNLTGDSTVGQFNPTTLALTEVAKPCRTLSKPPACLTSYNIEYTDRH